MPDGCEFQTAEAAKVVLGTKPCCSCCCHAMCILQKAISEDCVCEPWTPYAQYKWKVEQELSNIAELNYVVVRPAIVYGPGDRAGLSTFNTYNF